MQRSSLHSRAPFAASVAAIFAMATTGIAGTASPVVAANDHVRVDVSPEDGSGPVGGSVTLTVVVLDELDSPLDGSHARFYFLAGSANDPGSPGNNPDLSCTTDALGTCSVSYVAANAGVDLVCAVVSGGPQLCDSELLDDPELDGRSDLVRHTAGDGGEPDPTPSPTGDPDPNSTPAPSPTPSPSADPSPSPSPSADPSPSPSPSADPSPSPTPSADPSPSQSPSADPSPSPSPSSEPEPTPVPTPTPTPSTDPTPEPSPTPSPTVSPSPPVDPSPSPSPEPETTPDPSPAATATPPATPAPTVNPTPTPHPTTEPTPGPTTEPVTEPTDPPAPSEAPEASPSASPDPEAVPADPGADASSPPAADRHIAVGGPVANPGTAPSGPGTDAASNGGAILPPPGGFDGGILAIVSGVADQVSQSVKPAAAVAVAATFGFPLLLMFAVLLYLLVQSRLDGRDPKLRAAPLTTAETLIPFREEDVL